MVDRAGPKPIDRPVNFIKIFRSTAEDFEIYPSGRVGSSRVESGRENPDRYVEHLWNSLIKCNEVNANLI